MRGCCIAAPEFYIQAVFRNDDRIIVKQRAVAVLEGPKSSVKVFTCNSKAREAGVFPGMSKAKAQSWQNILLLKRSQRSEENAQATLLDCGFAVSRLVENTYPGIVLCDVTGTERLLGPPENTAKKLLEIACRCGLDTNIAIAPNPDAALHAARGFPGITIIGSGQERRVLAPLPLEVLDANPETLDKLRSWGVRTFRDLADLPAEAIVQRLGPVGFRLQQMAQGCSRRELIPVIPAPSFQEKVEPEEPLDCLEAVGSTAQKLLDHIVTRLNSRSLAARELHLELALEIDVDRELSSIRAGEESCRRFNEIYKVRFSEATQDPELMFKLLQLQLEKRPPQGFVKAVVLEALPARVRVVQHDFLRTNAPESVKLDLTLAHLRALTCQTAAGSENQVGFAVVNDSHTPNSFYVTDCLPDLDTQSSTKPSAVELLVKSRQSATRRINSRLSLKPNLARQSRASDAIVKGRKRNISKAAGPWFGNGEWWGKESHWNREEWDLELHFRGRKGLYRSFRNPDSDEWFMERMYD